MGNFISELMQATKSHPFLVHGRSILGQMENLNGNLVTAKEKTQLAGLQRIIPEYAKYYKANAVKGASRAIVKDRVGALNAYYNFIHENGLDNLFNAQTKFRPTILEEFMAILFRDLIEEVQNDCPCGKLNLGSVKAYANLYFYGKDFRSFIANPTIGLNLKDQDFAIFRNVELRMDDNKPVSASLPIVAVECKTFIDKTMLEGSVATAEKLKVGNPYALFCMVSELYDVSMNVDPAYSRIDQIYILRKSTRRGPWRDIDYEVVQDFVDEVKEHLTRPWSNIAKKLADTGKLI